MYLQLKNRLARLIVLGILLMMALSLNLFLRTDSASAAQTTPPPYAHGWYISNPDISATGAMYILGQNDGIRDNANCTNSAVILDFGQVKYKAGGPYGGYGVSAFGGFYTNSAVAQAAARYATGWFEKTGSCPKLHLILGINNLYQCPSGSACTPNMAGRQWGNLVNNVQQWLIAKNYAWQITAWAGDDMEQPDGVSQWDCPPKTRAFVDGFNANNPSAAHFIDYGTAWVGDCWKASDVYYVAYGARYNWPQPEIYKQTAMNSWINLGYPMPYIGVVTDCNNPTEPITGTYCFGSTTAWTPKYAWQQLWNKLKVTQSSLDYATNIQYQPKK